jgi:hypothetical protein
MPAPNANATARVKNSKTFPCPNGCEDGRITVTVASSIEDGRRVWLCSHFQTCDCEAPAAEVSHMEDEVIDEARAALAA